MKDTNKGAIRGLGNAVFGGNGKQVEIKTNKGATFGTVTPLLNGRHDWI